MNRRFALIQALVSLVALAAVVWWASQAGAARVPQRRRRDRLARAARSLLYARGHADARRALAPHPERHRRGRARGDCYALTTVGYMGNNVLPARAGEALRVVLLSGRCDASKRTLLGSVVAERLLDVIALAAIFVVVVYGVLELERAAHRPAAAVRRPPACCCWCSPGSALWVLRRHHVFERARDWLRPLADAPRALLGREGVLLLAATFVLWAVEAAVYLAVARSGRPRHQRDRRALPRRAHQLRRGAARRAGLDRHVRRRRGLRRTPLGASGSVAVSYLLLLRFVLYVPITRRRARDARRPLRRLVAPARGRPARGERAPRPQAPRAQRPRGASEARAVSPLDAGARRTASPLRRRDARRSAARPARRLASPRARRRARHRCR